MYKPSYREIKQSGIYHRAGAYYRRDVSSPEGAPIRYVRITEREACTAVKIGFAELARISLSL